MTIIVGTLILAVIDIASKYIVFTALGEPQNGHGTTIIPSFFYLTTRYNPGISWSWFAGTPVLILGFINLLILGAVIYVLFFTRKIPVNVWTKAAGMLIMAGAAGNLYDRIFCNGVRDFLDFIIPIWGYNYPIFNFADIFIVAGVILAFLEPNLVKLSSRMKKTDVTNG